MNRIAGCVLVALWAFNVVVALTGCGLVCRADVVRYNADGDIVRRWECVSDWTAEGGCITFGAGITEPQQTVCGNVAVVRR